MGWNVSPATPTTGRLLDLIPIGLLTSYFGRDVVEAAVDAAGAREQRSRLLPAVIVVYFCLAMVVYAPASSVEVWDRLVSGLQWTGTLARRPDTPSREAISRARRRLGWRAMAALLSRVAGPIASPADDGAYYSGLRAVTLETTAVDVPCSAKNSAAYGEDPKMLVVAAVEGATGALIGAVTGSPAAGVTRLAGDLAGHLDTGTLAVAGDGFRPQEVAALVRPTGSHLLCPARTPAGLPVLRSLGDGSYLSRPSGSAATVRVIADRTSSGSVLVTDLLEPARLTCAQARAAADPRWRLAHCLDALSGTGDGGLVLRSKIPELVRQEVFSALCVHQAIRGMRGAMPGPVSWSAP
jgi:hypothetical protein